MNQILMEVPIKIPIETIPIEDNKIIVRIDTRYLDLAIRFLKDYHGLQGSVNDENHLRSSD